MVKWNSLLKSLVLKLDQAIDQVRDRLVAFENSEQGKKYREETNERAAE